MREPYSYLASWIDQGQGVVFQGPIDAMETGFWTGPGPNPEATAGVRYRMSLEYIGGEDHRYSGTLVLEYADPGECTVVPRDDSVFYDVECPEDFEPTTGCTFPIILTTDV